MARKTKRLTRRTAGRLVRAVIYTPVLPIDPDRVRRDKLKVSSEARKRMNLRTSGEKLEIVMAANFEGDDLVVTLTYDDAHLPDSRKSAVSCLQKFLRSLRAQRRQRGEALHYIYVTEDKHGDGRIHHHVVLNATKGKQDFQEIRALWKQGTDTEISTIETQFDGYAAIATYFIKEPLEYGKPEKGKRVWTPSQGLNREVVEHEWVSEDMTITPPAGAWVLSYEPVVNGFGSFTYIKYMLPDRRKTKKPLGASGSEQCISNGNHWF